MALIFAFLAFFGWGVGDIFGTIATRRIGAYSTTFWFATFQFFVFILFAPIFWADLQRLTVGLLVFNLFLGLIALCASTTFYEAMSRGNASLSGTIVSSFAALTVLLSIIFLGERLNANQVIAIVTIFIGIVVSSLDWQSLKQKKLINSRSVLFAIASMILWGVYWAFLKVPVKEIGWYWPIVFSQVMYFLLFIFMKLRKIKLEKPNLKGALIFLILNSILLGAGSFSYNLGIERGLVAVVAPIAGAYSVLFAIFAYFIFKDSLSKREGLGILITLAGIVLLSFWSV